MKLRLETGKMHLSSEAKQSQEVHLRELNNAFTSPEAEAFLRELEVKPEPQKRPESITTQSKPPWYKPLLDLWKSILS